jgi:DNA-binding GntR family transcriptional regulator
MSDTLIYRTIPDQIADRLRREIISGRLQPGQVLREQEISDRFGVSRGPVREVFRQLSQQGLLITEPNKGVRVAKQPSVSVRPLVAELRRTIEVFALNTMFDEIAEEDIDAWEAILTDIEQVCRNEDRDKLVGRDLDFHRAILASHDESELVMLWQPIALRMLMHYDRFGDDLMACYEEHRRILDAIRRRDKAAAIAALVANIQ